MKRKSLFIVALSLVIVGSMLAGTMAQYVKAVDPGNVTPTYKSFIFTAEKSAGTNVVLKIAPGEKKSWVFSVRNYDATKRAETAMNISLAVLRASNVPTGLKFYVNDLPITAGDPGILAATLSGSKADSAAVVLSAYWEDSTDPSYDVKWQGAAGSVALQFTAKQAPDVLAVPDLAAHRLDANGDGVDVVFSIPDDIDLSLGSNSDIRIEYLYANGSYVIKNIDNTPLIKNKSWSSFLCTVGNDSLRYPVGVVADTAHPGKNLIPKGAAVSTTTYGSRSWLGAGKLVDLAKVIVTINDNGVIYKSEVAPQ